MSVVKITTYRKKTPEYIAQSIANAFNAANVEANFVANTIGRDVLRRIDTHGEGETNESYPAVRCALARCDLLSSWSGAHR